MGGPPKRRAQAEKKSSGSSGDSSSASRDPTQRSTPKSIPRLDGNRDPLISGPHRVPTEYSKVTDLKNISEFLGLAGWYTARGVSTNGSLSFLCHAARHFPSQPASCMSLQTPCISPRCCLAAIPTSLAMAPHLFRPPYRGI